MKQSKSLKSELIYDLSLLSFCALIISSGLLVIVLRIQMPAQMEPLSAAYLEGTHEAFASSLPTDPSLEPDQIRVLFDLFVNERGLREMGRIELGVLRGETQDSFEPESFRFLWVLPSVSGYRLLRQWGPYRFEYFLSISHLHQLLTRTKYLVFFASVLIAALLVFLGYQLLFKRNVLMPLRNLNDTAKSFLDENWDARCAVHRQDELGQVAGVLNEMASKIQDREKRLVLTIQSLQAANEEIESSKNEQLQIEKLASVGRLAAGVAHEVGNPLGAISGYVDILRRSIAGSPELSADVELCDRIEAETNRISRIIRALLQQARPPQDRIRPVALVSVLKRSVELAQIPPEIQLEYDIENEEAAALCEKDQLIQVCLNLLINARHAIESRDRRRKDPPLIRVRCVSRKLPQYSLESTDAVFDSSIVRSLKPQTYWMISVVDNGTGITPEDQKKLFEPFFSTKETGKGTGLGLYVAKSIVESFRGALIVQSSLGHGSSFSIFLPKGL